jgi:bidirectional [NiFe] hydrogenase diaphorase subunit
VEARRQAGEVAGSDRRLEVLDAAMRRMQHRPDALIEILHAAQALYGFLPLPVLTHVGRRLRVPSSRVYGVATFYNHFSLAPRGEHTCTVCMGTACYVKGAGAIVDALRTEMGVAPGGTTPDGKVSVVIARCVGACGIAPAVLFDHEMVGRLSTGAVMSRVRGWTR